MEIKFFWKEKNITDLTNYIHGGNSAKDSLVEELIESCSPAQYSEGTIWLDLFHIAKTNELGYRLEGFSNNDEERIIKTLGKLYLGPK